MVESIRYISVNSNHTFDFNYQKASLLELLDALKKNDSTSAKIKKMLIEKAQKTLGLNRLPDSDRVTPFFHCQEGEFHVTFLYDSVATSTPWEMIIANNFGDLIPLFLEIYDLLKKPIFNSSSATIGNYSVFHHQNAIGYHSNNTSPHRYLEYNNRKDTSEDTGEDLSCNEMDQRHNQLAKITTNQINKRSNKKVAINNQLAAIKKSKTSTKKKGRKNSLITETIQMSSSMPNLDNSLNGTIFTHRYATRHRKNNSILAVN